MKIKKVLNNNAVIVVDGGQEKIAIGAGVAFQKVKMILLIPVKLKSYFRLRKMINYSTYWKESRKSILF